MGLSSIQRHMENHHKKGSKGRVIHEITYKGYGYKTLMVTCDMSGMMMMMSKWKDHDKGG